MANPLFEQMNGAGPQMPQGMNNMIHAFQQFKAAFSGDPRKQVQAMLNSGQMTQAQYNQLSQMAQGLTRILR